MKIKYLFFIILSFVLLLGCKEKQKPKDQFHDELGSISIEITGNEKAKEHFEEGLLLMHSFEYADAAEAFKEAQQADPSCVMAFWGEAMTHNHPLWRQLNNIKGKEVLQEVGATTEDRLSRVPTEFEKDLFMGAEILFGEGDKADKDTKYRDHMEKLFNKYPDHHEVASLYALSILGAVRGGRNYEEYEKGARIAKGILNENPNHPGALHYLIHSYDDPVNAPKAMDAADSYAVVAPDAAHALHMPSHIYVSMGMWDRVISSNIDSWQASVKRKERKNLDNDALGYHSFKWLMYGHLQKEQFDSARIMVEDMERYCTELPSRRAKSHLVMMKGAYFTETGKWDDDLVLDTFDYSDLNIQAYAVGIYNRSMYALEQGEVDYVKEHIEVLEESVYEAGNEVIAAASATCSGNYTRNLANQDNVNRAKVIILELKALLALRDGNIASAEELMKEAVDLEDNTGFMYGPPDVVKPSSEMYGDWLVEQGRLEEARVQFEKVLERCPNRLLAVKGMEKTSTSS
ncbi:MAG: hypothetical protein HKN68_14195 [Saprospiraceae bacterium]|nr:hypothetical protein [Saprospiraceae bacterium]